MENTATRDGYDAMIDNPHQSGSKDYYRFRLKALSESTLPEGRVVSSVVLKLIEDLERRVAALENNAGLSQTTTSLSEADQPSRPATEEETPSEEETLRTGIDLLPEIRAVIPDHSVCIRFAHLLRSAMESTSKRDIEEYVKLFSDEVLSYTLNYAPDYHTLVEKYLKAVEGKDMFYYKPICYFFSPSLEHSRQAFKEMKEVVSDRTRITIMKLEEILNAPL